MTVVRNLRQQLILAHAPWMLGGMLIVFILAASWAGVTLLFAGEVSGLAALVLGAGLPFAIFILAIQRDQAIFDGAAGTVTLQRRTFWRYTRSEHRLADVAKAELEEISDIARPVLVIGPKHRPTRLPLVDVHLSGNSPRHAVDTINAWLAALRRDSAA